VGIGLPGWAIRLAKLVYGISQYREFFRGAEVPCVVHKVIQGIIEVDKRVAGQDLGVLAAFPPVRSQYDVSIGVVDLSSRASLGSSGRLVVFGEGFVCGATANLIADASGTRRQQLGESLDAESASELRSLERCLESSDHPVL
jgi:hypothetical protein